MAFHRLILPEIQGLIEEKKWGDLKRVLHEIPVPDLAELLLNLDKKERGILFRMLPKPLSSEVFSYFDSSHKDALLKEMTNGEARHLLADLSPDDRAQFFEELPGQATQMLLDLLSPEDRKETLTLLGYPEESVGRFMTPDYVAVRAEWTIEQALEHIRNKGKDSETIDVIYVVDPLGKLIDDLDLSRLILAKPSDSIEQIMDHAFVSIMAYDDREKAVQLTQRYDLYVLPVIDSDGILVGIVTVDDVMDVAQEEATEDFQKVAAVAPLKTSYRESGIWTLYRKRIGWLVALVLVSLASSGVIAAYEETLASAIALAFFIPFLIGSGGNTGSQSATLIVRAMATGDVKVGEWLWAVGREIGVGMLLGLTMGSCAWILGLFRGGFEIGIVVGLAMASIVVVANMVGVALPFLLSRFRLDPAVASSPLITSIVDVVGLIIYFSIATGILHLSG